MLAEDGAQWRSSLVSHKHFSLLRSCLQRLSPSSWRPPPPTLHAGALPSLRPCAAIWANLQMKKADKTMTTGQGKFATSGTILGRRESLIAGAGLVVSPPPGKSRYRLHQSRE